MAVLGVEFTSDHCEEFGVRAACTGVAMGAIYESAGRSDGCAAASLGRDRWWRVLRQRLERITTNETEGTKDCSARGQVIGASAGHQEQQTPMWPLGRHAPPHRPIVVVSFIVVILSSLCR